MGRRGRRESRLSTGVSTDAREAVERRWHHRMTREPRLAAMVTARGARSERFHRWMACRQGFSPELVRVFLGEAKCPGRDGPDRPVLDPFSGSGTVVLECALRGVRAIGVEAMASLAFLSAAVGERGVPELPDLDDCTTWQTAADRLELPIHRAALMYAVGRRHTSAGTLTKNAPPLLDVLHEVVGMMRTDLRRPLPLVNPIRQGDARKLDGLEAGSIAGIITSPPYLSRHDYTKVFGPYETVYGHWYAGRSVARRRSDQLAAHPAILTRPRQVRALPAAADEARAALAAIGERKLAAVVSAYFDDMSDVLAQCGRVLPAGAPCWLVVGGARLKGVYIPADLIIAELAAACGFAVESVRVARNLIEGGRKLGRLPNVAPRESILELRKR